MRPEKEQIDHIAEEIIAPRTRRESPSIVSVLRGLFTPWARNKAESFEKCEKQRAHVILMTYLIQNRDSYGPEFWASIVKWQIIQYQEQCSKLLQDYKSATKNNSLDKNRALIVDALEKAVHRVYALEEPEKPTVVDVFVIRNIYDDPDLSTVVSACFTSEQQVKLAKVVREMLLQQPAFPQPCWTLIEGQDVGNLAL